jgi:hypothetical protein
MAAGAVLLNSSEAGQIDTFLASQWDLVGLSPSTKMDGLVVDNGEWIKLADCSIESGPEGAPLTVNGGNQIHLTDPHLLGHVNLNGGTGTKITGGEALLSNVHGVQIAGGTNTLIDGLAVTDVGEGYNAIDVSNGVDDFTVVNCDLGYNMIGATKPTNLVRVGATANPQDRYIITNNRGRNYTGAALLDNGEGVNKIVTGNVFVP